MELSLRQKLLIAVLAGVAVGVVSVLVQHHATRYLQSRSVRTRALPPAR